jgi:hypothetical protein
LLPLVTSSLWGLSGARAGVPHEDDVTVVETLTPPVIDLARHVDG